MPIQFDSNRYFEILGTGLHWILIRLDLTFLDVSLFDNVNTTVLIFFIWETPQKPRCQCLCSCIPFSHPFLFFFFLKKIILLRTLFLYIVLCQTFLISLP